jgi:hypothetical protein
MLHFVSAALLFCCVILPACTSVQYNQTDFSTLPSDTFWSGNVALQCQEYRRLQAETAYRTEVAEMLKSYRECLKKYDADPGQGQARCSAYAEVFQDSPAITRPSK